MIVTCDAIQAAEKRLFETGVEAEPLMERAGKGCAEAIRQWFPRPCRAILFVGKGNNGGDALVIGRELRKRGWSVVARYAGSASELTDLAAKKREEFEAVSDGDASPRRPLVLVDGLLGIGARGPLRGGLGELAMEMNQFRFAECATTFAVDIPSGIDGDSGE
ncbi:MAG: NAD(P)H-hydrate epimerase, partial [Verrucomicrobiae bacterium]|nr:NAD(P)H-hydrate epimerase [Verrucomicrobiae bacterium]